MLNPTDSFTIAQIEAAVFEINENKLRAALNHGYSEADGWQMVRVRLWEDLKTALEAMTKAKACPMCGRETIQPANQ